MDAEKPGLQAFTHWFIIDEQWMAEKPGLQDTLVIIEKPRLASFHTLVYYR